MFISVKRRLAKQLSIVFGSLAICLFFQIDASAEQTQQEYIFLLDTSRSMATNKLLAPLRVAIDDYADTIPVDGTCRVWVFTFDRGIRKSFSRVIRQTEDMQEVKIFLASVEAKGSDTHIYRSLADVLEKVYQTQNDGQQHSFIIHLFTDGQDNSPRKYTFESNIKRFTSLRAANRERLELYYHTLGVTLSSKMQILIGQTDGITLIPGTKPEIPPNADFNFPDGILHNNMPITFVDKTVGKVDTWHWIFGDNQTSNESDPTHTFIKPGDYRVQLTATNPAGPSIATKIVKIEGSPPTPKFEISNPQDQIVGKQVTFLDKSTGEIDSRSWDFGDDSPPSSEKNPSHIYQKAGQYTVILMLSGPFGKSQESKVINIAHERIKKVLDFEWRPLLPKMGEAVYFSNLSSIYKDWQWDLGDGTTSNDHSPSHQYNQDGRYTVTLSGKDIEGTRDTKSKTVVVCPKAQFVLRKRQIVVGEPIQVENQSTGQITKWKWNMGDQAKSVVETRDPEFAYNEAGTFTMILEIEGPFGRDSTQQQIIVLSEELSFSIEPNSPDDEQNAQFMVKTIGDFGQWQWDFGDGTSSNDKNPRHAYELVSGPDDQLSQHSGEYTVVLSAIGPDGQLHRVSKQIKVRPIPPKAEFQLGFSEIRVKTEFTLYDRSSGTITRYEWDMGDGTQKSGREVNHTYQEPNTVTIKLTVSNDTGQSDFVTKTVEVTKGEPPKLNFQVADGYTVKGRAPLHIKIQNNSTGMILGHHWAFGDDTTSDAVHPEHTYEKAGNYIITYWVDTPYGQVGPIDSMAVQITVLPPPPAFWLYPVVFLLVILIFRLQPIHRRKFSFATRTKGGEDGIETIKKGVHHSWFFNKKFDSFKVCLKRHWLYLNKRYVFTRVRGQQAIATKKNGRPLDRDRLVKHAEVKYDEKTIQFRELSESKRWVALIYYLIFGGITYKLVNILWEYYLRNLY